MEKILFVVNNDLTEVNRILQKGGKVKMIQPVAQPIGVYGFSGAETSYSSYGKYDGDVYVYIVVEI